MESRQPEDADNRVHQPGNGVWVSLAGGSWKVAAADFFTAMMALFMVMWILAQDDEKLEDIANYFNNPFTSFADDNGGILDLKSDGNRIDSTEQGEGSHVPSELLERIATAFQRGLNVDSLEDQEEITVDIQGDSLRIVVFDRGEKPIFHQDTADFTDWGRLVMQNLSWTIEDQANRYFLGVRIAAHTRMSYESGRENYGPWELSVDQANAARRELVNYALDPGKIDQIIGYGGSSPLPDRPLDDPSQQRLELSLTLR